MPQRLVVVGASLAGLRAVEAARRAGYDGAITLIGAERHLPYDRPPLSKEFLEASTQPIGPRTFRDEEFLRDQLGVDLLLGTPATGLDPEERQVLLNDRRLSYSALVIATGAAPRRLAGADAVDGVHILRTLDDARQIRSDLDEGA